MSSQTVDVPKRIPLLIAPENRATSVDKDSRLVNGFSEKQDDGDQYIYRRPGFTQTSQPSGGAAVGRGVFNWLGNVYAIFGNTLYKDGVAVAGTVDTTNGVYRFDSCLGATPKLQLGNGIEAYNYDTGAGLVNIGDVDFPSAFRKGWAYLNGTTYVALTGSGGIQNSDINDPTSWDALDIVVAQIEPDFNIALAKQLVYVIDFKQWSTEVFYDAANASGSPLARVEGAKVDFGCASQDSVQNIDGMLVWLTATKSPLRQVALMKGLKSEIVSNAAVERLLSSWTLTTVYSWQLRVAGHRWYVITSVVNNITLVYDIDQLAWYQWTDASGNYVPIVSSTYAADNSPVLQHASDGYLYTASMAAYADTAGLIQVDIYTPGFDGGTQRKKTLTVMTFLADQVTGSTLQVRYNDDDYQAMKWSNFRNVDLGQQKPLLSNCGTFRRRAWNLRHRQAVEFRIQAVEPQLDVGTT
jgi:hypothetical protein